MDLIDKNDYYGHQVRLSAPLKRSAFFVQDIIVTRSIMVVMKGIIRLKTLTNSLFNITQFVLGVRFSLKFLFPTSHIFLFYGFIDYPNLIRPEEGRFLNERG